MNLTFILYETWQCVQFWCYYMTTQCSKEAKNKAFYALLLRCVCMFCFHMNRNANMFMLITPYFFDSMRHLNIFHDFTSYWWWWWWRYRSDTLQVWYTFVIRWLWCCDVRNDTIPLFFSSTKLNQLFFLRSSEKMKVWGICLQRPDSHKKRANEKSVVAWAEAFFFQIKFMKWRMNERKIETAWMNSHILFAVYSFFVFSIHPSKSDRKSRYLLSILLFHSILR